MIQVIASPYYLGHRNVGMGAGPTALLDGGLLERLEAAGHRVEAHVIDVPEAPQHEIGATFATLRTLARAVREAAPAFPIILGGNCNVCLGIVAGLAPRRPGVVWFDAHGDFHSPETTASGFFDGFPLHMMVGQSWTALTRTIPNFQPVSQSDVLMVGNRDLDAGEDALLAASDVVTYDEDAFGASGLPGYEAVLDPLRSRVEGLYVHVDLDVLDRDRVPANPYSAPGGLAPETLAEALGRIRGPIPVMAASLNCYSPDGDPEGRALSAGTEVIAALATLGEHGEPVRS